MAHVMDDGREELWREVMRAGKAHLLANPPCPIHDAPTYRGFCLKCCEPKSEESIAAITRDIARGN